MIIITLISISLAAVSALLVTIILEHKHDSEEKEEREEEMTTQTNYFVCEDLQNKKKTYIAIPKEAMGEVSAKKYANAKYFKTKEENLESTLGYVKSGQLYYGLLPAKTVADKVWIISRKNKKEDKNEG